MKTPSLRSNAPRAVAVVWAMLWLTLITSSTVHAATLAGVSVSDQTQVDGKGLVLNGLGMRTATLLKVKVYVIGLYLEQKSTDAKAIIESSQPKHVVMHFVRDVPAKDLRKGWLEAFDNNYPNVADVKVEIEKFNASMRDVNSGDKIALDFYDDRVDVLINATNVVSIKGNAFQQAALSIWLGPKPPNEDLKAGILGG